MSYYKNYEDEETQTSPENMEESYGSDEDYDRDQENADILIPVFHIPVEIPHIMLHQVGNKRLYRQLFAFAVAAAARKAIEVGNISNSIIQ